MCMIFCVHWCAFACVYFCANVPMNMCVSVAVGVAVSVSAPTVHAYVTVYVSVATVQVKACEDNSPCRLAPSVGWQKTQWQPAYASRQSSSVPGGLSSSCTPTPVAAPAATTGSSLPHSCCTWQPSLLAWGRCLGLSMPKYTLYR